MVVALAAIPPAPTATVLHAPAPAAVAPAPVLPMHATPAVPAATHKGWTPWLQVAAVRSEQDVQREWHRLQARLPDLLGGRSLTVSQGEAHDHTYWRLRTGGFASLADVNALCLRIRSAGGTCLAVVTSDT
jgi:cell division septation protein DedD